jgi:hypothetical protein
LGFDNVGDSSKVVHVPLTRQVVTFLLRVHQYY